MPLRCRVPGFSVFLATLFFTVFFAPFSTAQQPTGAGKALTIERIYSQPSLSGRLTRGLAWTPDGKGLSYFETKGSGKEAKTELWVMDAASGERRLLVGADKLESILPVDTSRPTQATGLGRRAPAQYLHPPRATSPRSSISMGAGWHGHFVSGPHGACVAGFEDANRAHAGFRQGYTCRPQDFS